MKTAVAMLLSALLVGPGLSGCSSDKKSEKAESKPVSEQPLTREDSVDVNMTARVAAVDYGRRLLTLRDETGREVTVRVDSRVRRLNEVRPGDDVNTHYTARLLAELRPPTAEEAADPFQVIGARNRAAQGDAPAADHSYTIMAVTTVEAVDVPNMLVTLRGPMGDRSVVRGKKLENVQRLRVGDTIVLTYSHSMAISVEKIVPKY